LLLVCLFLPSWSLHVKKIHKQVAPVAATSSYIKYGVVVVQFVRSVIRLFIPCGCLLKAGLITSRCMKCLRNTNHLCAIIGIDWNGWNHMCSKVYITTISTIIKFVQNSLLHGIGCCNNFNVTELWSWCLNTSFFLSRSHLVCIEVIKCILLDSHNWIALEWIPKLLVVYFVEFEIVCCRVCSVPSGAKSLELKNRAPSKVTRQL